mmetsp:Transcript_2313/g.5741  ORF Transcript_2313/g.5741 Transcript_2313/m.5741 type:complete len:88 (+) Transcript_2313:308-571(+)
MIHEEIISSSPITLTMMMTPPMLRKFSIVELLDVNRLTAEKLIEKPQPTNFHDSFGREWSSCPTISPHGSSFLGFFLGGTPREHMIL